MLFLFQITWWWAGLDTGSVVSLHITATQPSVPSQLLLPSVPGYLLALHHYPEMRVLPRRHHLSLSGNSNSASLSWLSRLRADGSTVNPVCLPAGSGTLGNLAHLVRGLRRLGACMNNYLIPSFRTRLKYRRGSRHRSCPATRSALQTTCRYSGVASCISLPKSGNAKTCCTCSIIGRPSDANM